MSLSRSSARTALAITLQHRRIKKDLKTAWGEGRGERRRTGYEGLRGRKSQTAADVLSSGERAKKMGKEETDLFHSKESLKSKIFLAARNAAWMNQALPAPAAFGPAYLNIF